MRDFYDLPLTKEQRHAGIEIAGRMADVIPSDFTREPPSLADCLEQVLNAVRPKNAWEALSTVSNILEEGEAE